MSRYTNRAAWRKENALTLTCRVRDQLEDWLADDSLPPAYRDSLANVAADASAAAAALTDTGVAL